MTDKELIERFQRGNEKAFDDLVKRHYPDTYQFFYRMVQDAMDADDLCQETYIRVHRGLNRFHFKSEFTTWLYRVSINVANSYFRKRKIWRLLISQQEPDEIAVAAPKNDPGNNTELWSAIGRLPRRQRIVLILRVFQELPFKEVAAVIGISENSAKVNYHYAIKSLKGMMGED